MLAKIKNSSFGNPQLSCYSLTERKGWLRLKPTATTLDKATSPTFVARHQTEKCFTSTTLLDASHLTEGMQAGITVYAAPLNHYDVVVEKKDQFRRRLLLHARTSRQR